MNRKYKIVAVNGAFDVLTVAHCRFLKFAAYSGDRLVVGINSDSSIKKYKGQSRPINNQNDRKEFLLSFDFVDDVVIFDELNAVEFLKKTTPSVYVVGGNYNINTMNQEELKYLQSINAEIKFFDKIEGYSSTNIINKLNEN